MDFTAHPILFSDGSLTIPDSDWDMSQHPVFVAVRAILRSVYRGGVAGKSVVDLGCLEGGYTVEFARLGMRATGIEVRRSNFENCLYVKTKVDLPHLEFVQDDVWNVEKYGSFDVVFCCGLLYHLAEPRRYLDILSRVCRGILILDTHYATQAERTKFPLSPLTLHEGVSGRWFTEYDKEDDVRREDAKWASWGNARSFWPLKSELLPALRACGFSFAFDEAIHRPAAEQRTMLVAFK
jgi:SAM-dependent methyltransferase